MASRNILTHARNRKLTSERLKEVLVYDEQSGLFYWKRRPKVLSRQAGCVKSDGYVAIQVDGALHRAHNLAWLYVYGH